MSAIFCIRFSNAQVGITGPQLIKNALYAYEQGYRPLALPPKGSKAMALYVSNDNLAVFEGIARRLNTPIAQIIEQLAYSCYQASLDQSVESVSPIMKARDRLFHECMGGLIRGNIVLAEASTGIGKSRILARLAKTLLTQSDTRICVAGPTNQVVQHLLSEFHSADLNPKLLLGRYQFLSLRRLARLLDELSDEASNKGLIDKINEWLSRGAPPLCPHTQLMERAIPGLSYMVDDLLHISTEIPDYLIRLSDGHDRDDEPASKVIDRMRHEAKESRLVLCTQTMMLLDAASIESTAPIPYTHLLVDEIHLLEETAATLRSTTLALSSLRRIVRRHLPSRQDEALDLISALSSRLSHKQDDCFLHDKEDGLLVDQMNGALEVIRTMLEKARKPSDETLFQERQEAIQHLSHFMKQSQFFIRFSPILKYPSISAGPANVGNLLGSLWKRAVGAVGVSGTIFLTKADGSLYSGYTTVKLAIPKDRNKLVGPITMPWVTSTPTVYLPPSPCPTFCYPKDVEINEDDSGKRILSAAYAEWATNLIGVLELATKSAVGGTIVLCTSYNDVVTFGDYFKPRFEDRVLVQTRGVAVQRLKDQFIELHRKEMKPIWFAAGVAWTGLDLRDSTVSPAMDRLLTDLIVVRFPYSLNRSTTFQMRRTVLGAIADLAEAEIVFRQGLGRLIRAEGLESRKIWILDGRLNTPGFKYSKVFRNILSNYPKKKTFDVADVSAGKSAFNPISKYLV